jgi:hypothetical protein
LWKYATSGVVIESTVKNPGGGEIHTVWA